MDKKTESDLVLALLGIASHTLEPDSTSPVHDSQKEVVKNYNYLKVFMEPLAAGLVTFKAVEYYKKHKDKNPYSNEIPLDDIVSSILTDQGYIRMILHDDPLFH